MHHQEFECVLTSYMDLCFEMNFWVSEHGPYPQLVSSCSPELIRLRILCSDWIGVSRVSKLGCLFVWPRQIVL